MCAVLDHSVVVLVVLISAHRFHCASLSHTRQLYLECPASAGRCIIYVEGIAHPTDGVHQSHSLNILCVAIISSWYCLLKCFPDQTLLGGALAQVCDHPLLDRRGILGESDRTHRTYHQIVILLMRLVYLYA